MSHQKVTVMLAVLFFLVGTAICRPPALNHLVGDQIDPEQLEKEHKDFFFINERVKPEGVHFGDVKLSIEQEEVEEAAQEHFHDDEHLDGRKKRGLLRYLNYRWPDGLVPVTISSAFYTNGYINKIRAAMYAIEDATCITFLEYPAGSAPTAHLNIISGTGCWSSIGRRGVAQDLSLEIPGCLWSTGTPIHEFLHALGFFHEQSRGDRDNYVRIFWDRIRAGTESNFQKASQYLIPDYLGVPYDKKSVMHYKSWSFQTSNLPTIESLTAPYDDIGGEVLTDSDKLQLNLYYECPAKNTPTTTTTTPTTTTTTRTTTTTTPTTTTTTPTTTTMTPTTTTTTPTTTTTTNPTGCVDAAGKGCHAIKVYEEVVMNQFCQSDYYSTYCKATCNLCTTPTTLTTITTTTTPTATTKTPTTTTTTPTTTTTTPTTTTMTPTTTTTTTTNPTACNDAEHQDCENVLGYVGGIYKSWYCAQLHYQSHCHKSCDRC